MEKFKEKYEQIKSDIEQLKDVVDKLKYLDWNEIFSHVPESDEIKKDVIAAYEELYDISCFLSEEFLD